MGTELNPCGLRSTRNRAVRAAGVMIFITSISFNLLTDGLRSAMDIKA